MAEMIADRHKVRGVQAEKLGYCTIVVTCSSQYDQFQLLLCFFNYEPKFRID